MRLSMGIEPNPLHESQRKCDVCALPITESAKVIPEHHLDRDWTFCSPDCVLAFFKNPEQYLSIEDEEEGEV